MRKQTKTPPPLDTLLLLHTPEGIQLALPLAGPLARGGAWFIDVLIRIALYSVLGNLLSTIGTSGFGLFLICIFLMEWFYPALLEVVMQGATPGKKLFGLKVIHEDGTPVGWRAALLRNLLWPVDFLPGFYALGLMSCFMSNRFQRIGDMAAGTLVIYQRARQTKKPPQIPTGAASTPAISLTPDEQQAVLDFAYRSQQLTTDRSAELAELTGPLVNQQTGLPAREKLLSIARFIAGADQ